MVVEPCLADADKAGVAGQGDQVLDGGKGFFSGTHRMGARSIEHLRMRLGDRADGGFVPEPGADRDHPVDPCRHRTGNDTCMILRQIGKVEVAMAVDKVGQGKGHLGGLPLGEGTSPLVDLQKHIHQKGGRVKIDRLAATGAGRE